MGFEMIVVKQLEALNILYIQRQTVEQIDGCRLSFKDKTREMELKRMAWHARGGRKLLAH